MSVGEVCGVGWGRCGGGMGKVWGRCDGGVVEVWWMCGECVVDVWWKCGGCVVDVFRESCPIASKIGSTQTKDAQIAQAYTGSTPPCRPSWKSVVHCHPCQVPQ